MKIEELREQSEAMTEERDLLVLHRELNELRAEATVLGQQQEFMESWGSTVDPTEYLHDDPDYAMGIVTADGYQHISQVGDRQNGENYPTFRTEQELGAIRGAARILCDVFPTAKTAKENLLCFVLGTGFTCKPVGEETCADDLLAAVQAAVKRFFRCNQWAAIEEEIYWRPHRDGESFLALVGNPGEMPELRIVEPEQVTEPTSAAEIEEWLRKTRIGKWDGETPGDWSFGVHAEKGRPENVWGYYVQWSDDPQDWDYIPAARMVHVKRNVDRKIKRGLSDFYAVQSYLTSTGKLDRNVAAGAAVLSAIIGIVQHATASQSQVQGMIGSNPWTRRTVATPAGSSKTEYTQKVSHGSFINVPKGTEYKNSPLANQGVGQAFVTIRQALSRVIGGNWLMPEYMISMDASNANYSSTLVAESPFVKFCGRQQRDFSTLTREVLWKALDVLCRAGWFRRWGIFGVDDLADRIDLKITGPLVAARDKNAETNRNKILNDAGQLSDESWAEKEGLDRQREVARGAQRSAATLPGGNPIIGPRTMESRAAEASALLWESYP